MHEVIQKLKWLAIALGLVLALFMRDAALGLLIGFSVITGCLWIGSWFINAMSSVGRFFIPHGLIAGIVGFLLTFAPSFQFGVGNAIMPDPYAVSEYQAWILGSHGTMGVMVIGAIILSLIFVAVVAQMGRNQCVVERGTHPMVAASLAKDGKFAGFVTVDKSVVQAPIGAMPSPMPEVARVPMIGAGNGKQAPLPEGWVNAKIDPAHLLDDVLIVLMQKNVEFKQAEGASILVKRADVDVIRRVVVEVAEKQGITL